MSKEEHRNKVFPNKISIKAVFCISSSFSLPFSLFKINDVKGHLKFKE